MRHLTALAPVDAAAVRRLVAEATAHDGLSPLNEDALLALEHPADEHHVLLDGDDGLVGHAVRDRHGHGQAVVCPAHRGLGHGNALVAALGPVDAWWSFGDLPVAHAWAQRSGLVPVRELLIMERDLVAHPAAPATPRPGTILRALTDADVDALLAVNAAAFAHHREQGALDRAAFAARAAEDWFRAEDVLLADAADGVVGFHWTKRHGDGLGEVYVLGVHPAAEGRGVGRLLLDAGLAHLAEVGCHRVQLYVDGHESRPVGLYRSAHFDVRQRDLAWARAEGDS